MLKPIYNKNQNKTPVNIYIYIYKHMYKQLRILKTRESPVNKKDYYVQQLRQANESKTSMSSAAYLGFSSVPAPNFLTGTA